MAGQIVAVSPMRRFDFSTTALDQTTTLVLMQNIDVTEWGTASLLVRIGAVDMSGGTLQIVGALDSLSPDDPRASFAMPPISGDGIPISVLINSVTVAPDFSVVNLFGSLGAGMRVMLLATRTAGAGNLAATMSVDLCLKNEILEPQG